MKDEMDDFRRAFDDFDANKDGTITTSELYAALRWALSYMQHKFKVESQVQKTTILRRKGFWKLRTQTTYLNV